MTGKLLLYIMMLALAIPHGVVMAGERALSQAQLDEIESRTLRPYFNALKNGNVKLLKRYFSEEMYAEYRVLLEENRGYPETLRKHYKDAVFSVEQGVTSDSGIIVDFSIEHPGRGKQVVQYYLQEQNSESDYTAQVADGAQWKIIGQRFNSHGSK